MKTPLSILLAAIAVIGSASGELVEVPIVGASMELPQGWKVERMQSLIFLVPPNEEQDRDKNRKIHLQGLKGTPKTLQEALESEMDRVTEQFPRGNTGRNSFVAAVPVRTASGMEGLRATFATEASGGRDYEIIKYYFKRPDGGMFKVCAHVYGDEAKLQEYEASILSGVIAGTPKTK